MPFKTSTPSQGSLSLLLPLIRVRMSLRGEQDILQMGGGWSTGLSEVVFTTPLLHSCAACCSSHVTSERII